MIAVLDFGSQVTRLISKRLRELGFQSEIYPASKSWESLEPILKNSQGIILSGSHLSVGESLDLDTRVMGLSKPILGICFGYQSLAAKLGGKVEASQHREYGSAKVEIVQGPINDPLLKNLPNEFVVWMSHGDSVTELPTGATLLLKSSGKAAAYAIPTKKIWGLQFHPEVHHTQNGDQLLRNFAEGICGLKEDWNLKDRLEEVLTKLRIELKGVERVFCGVSGGVDSSVLAVLLSKVVKVEAIFIDHGFQRTYDLKDLEHTFSHYPEIRLHKLDESKRFWSELKGVSDPELKRKIIGRLFIESFESYVEKLLKKDESLLLGQGTIYSDVIESAGAEGGVAAKIKSHHNVGGLPDKHNFKLVEPLRLFFKDEVRSLGALLGIQKEFLERHPFPGPGLAIRVAGKLEPERVELLRKADAIMYEELRARNLYTKIWQSACILLPVQSVGVMGDGRTYESPALLRFVDSVDAMTAEASEIPFHHLKEIASRICNEVRGINRVLFDLTSKPPGTIEWE